MFEIIDSSEMFKAFLNHLSNDLMMNFHHFFTILIKKYSTYLLIELQENKLKYRNVEYFLSLL